MNVLLVTFFNPENYGVRVLGAVLRQQGHNIHILQVKKWNNSSRPFPPSSPGWHIYIEGEVFTMTEDLSLSPVEEQLFRDVLTKYAPDILGISAMSTFDSVFPIYASLIRQALPQCSLVAGGVGPTLNPLQYLTHGAEAVIRGEGEKALVDFIAAKDAGLTWDSIPGICFSKNGVMHCNPLAPLQENLDVLPLPLLDPEAFISINDNALRHNVSPCEQGVYTIMGSRGCIGHCTYCAAPHLRSMYPLSSAAYIRNRSFEKIQEELYKAKALGAHDISFSDDFFIRPVQRLKEFFLWYKREIALPLTMFLHPQQLLDHEDLIDFATEAGLRSAAFGIQNASKAHLQKIYKRATLCTNYASLAEKLISRHIPVNFHLIFGDPLESSQDFDENLHFAAQFPLDPARKASVHFHIMFLCYIEGSELMVQTPQILRQNRDVKKWYYQCVLLELRQMTSDDQFQEIRKNAALKKDIHLLAKLRDEIYNRIHFDYLLTQSTRLQNKKVIFFGCGSVYSWQKSYFKESHPQCIIVDAAEKYPKKVDGLPLLNPKEAFERYPSLPVVVFCNKKSIPRLMQRWKRLYPWIQDIVPCTQVRPPNKSYTGS